MGYRLDMGHMVHFGTTDRAVLNLGEIPSQIDP